LVGGKGITNGDQGEANAVSTEVPRIEESRKKQNRNIRRDGFLKKVPIVPTKARQHL